MRYGQATHGWWCNSRTYPTRCSHCGKRVYFFTCDCGCKVFFDELGEPWPEHACLEYLVHQYGSKFIGQGLATMMMTPGVETGCKIEKDYAARVTQRQRTQHKPETVCQEPYEGAMIEVEGLILELIAIANTFNKLDVPETPMGAAILGEIAKGMWSQITIHTGALADDTSQSYTFLVRPHLVTRKGIIIGDFVSCKLRALTIAGRWPVWICDGLSGAFV